MLALSTTKEEYVATVKAIKEEIWVEQIMDEFKMMYRNITLHYDSQSTIHLVKDPTFHDHMKHIDIKYHLIRKVVEEGRIMLEKVDTNENTIYVLLMLVKIEKFEW